MTSQIGKLITHIVDSSQLTIGDQSPKNHQVQEDSYADSVQDEYNYDEPEDSYSKNYSDESSNTFIEVEDADGDESPPLRVVYDTTSTSGNQFRTMKACDFQAGLQPHESMDDSYEVPILKSPETQLQHMFSPYDKENQIVYN